LFNKNLSADLCLAYKLSVKRLVYVVAVFRTQSVNGVSKLKKSAVLTQVNPILATLSQSDGNEVRLEAVCETEMDELWSYL